MPYPATRRFRFILALLLAGFALPLGAHTLGQGYIFLKVYDDRIEGRFEVTLNDLNTAFGLTGTDSLITLENLDAHLPRVQAYLTDRIAFRHGGQTFPIRFTGHDVRLIEKLSHYALLDFELADIPDPRPQQLDVRYDLVFDKDPDHQGLLVIEHFWKANLFNNERIISLVFGADDTEQTLDLSDVSMFKGMWGVIKMGIKHILIGIDHILFLIALILPAVMIRREEAWAPVPAFRPALIYVIKIVTLFTIAHSVTLSLAALDIFDLPGPLVESIIALSIAIAALDILFPIFHKRIGIVVFVFGLFHGFGFASVLRHLGVLGEHMALSLFGFNLGVEIGQVAIIVAVFPVLFLFRHLSLYRTLILRFGAVALIGIAMFWFVERAFG